MKLRPAKALAVLVGVCLLLSAGLSLSRAWLSESSGGSALSHDTLPFYASADLHPRWDRISSWRTIGSFALKDQHTKVVDEDLFGRGESIVSFFFAACTTACPVSIDMLRNMHGKFGSDAPQFVSMTVNPHADDSKALLQFAKKIDLPFSWILLTGAPDEVQRFAREGLLSDVSRLGPDGLPPHTERTLLIDRHHRIRGIYNATSPYEIVRLKHDVERLRAEDRSASSL